MRKCGDRRIAEVAQLGVHLARRFWGAGSASDPESGRSDRQASDHPNATDRRGSLRAVVRRAGWSREIPRPSHDAWRRIAEERQVVCGWHEERIDQRRGLLTERTGGQRRVLTERTGGQRRVLTERAGGQRRVF